jgi:hypothetical protein
MLFNVIRYLCKSLILDKYYQPKPSEWERTTLGTQFDIVGYRSPMREALPTCTDKLQRGAMAESDKQWLSKIRFMRKCIDRSIQRYFPTQSKGHPTSSTERPPNSRMKRKGVATQWRYRCAFCSELRELLWAFCSDWVSSEVDCLSPTLRQLRIGVQMMAK